MVLVMKDIFWSWYSVSKDVQNLHKDLLFLSQRIKIEKVEKLLANLHYQKEYVIHIRMLKQTLNYGLVLRKVHRVIKFNQKAWLNPYIDMNTELRKKPKHCFEKYFYKLMKNRVFGKSMENHSPYL